MSEESRYDALTDVRIRAQDAANAGDAATLLSLAGELRELDDEWWATQWAPLCAIRAAGLGRMAEARAFLEEGVAGGFCQASDYEPELSAVFGGEPDWEKTLARIAANVPAPPVELVEWPRPVVALPLQLERLPGEREELLRSMIPEPTGSAWETALRLLEWTSNRWPHGNNYQKKFDAVTLLTGVEEGERFSCVGYTTVLTQGLNAVGIPARRVRVRQRDHHVGVSRGHVVSEAWIDDLGCWVLLDGQNGLYWHEGGRPLGLPEILERYRAGEGPTSYTASGSRFREADAVDWWAYFATAVVGDTALVDGPISPVFQGTGLQRCKWVLTDPALLYPDLSAVDVGFDRVDGRVGLLLGSGHPYAEGFVVEGVGVDGVEVDASGGEGGYALPVQVAGEHRVEVRVRVRSGFGVVGGGSGVVYRVA